MSGFDKATLDRLLEIGGAYAVTRRERDGDPFAIVPSGWSVESLAKLCPPSRIRHRVQLLESGSFIDYVNRYKTADTLIFAKVTDEAGEFKAMLDYHGAAPALKAAYCEHVAVFTPFRTVEFDAWMKADRVKLGQMEFAVWLEENAALLVEPTGAELLELVTSLHGHTEARFNQTFRLVDGGCRLQYDEDIVVRGSSTTTSKPGDLELPALLRAGIAPFNGMPVYPVTARLKTRIDNRKLSLWIETVDVHKIIRDSLLLTVRAIVEKTGLIPLIGIP